MINKVGKLTGIIFLLLIFTCSVTAMAGIKKEITESFNVSPGGELNLETEIGSLEITASNTNRVEIKITLDSRTRDEERAQDLFEDFEVEFTQDGEVVEIYAEYYGNNSKGWNIFGRSNRNKIRVKFEISVPEKYDIFTKTSGGSIKIRDVEGKIDVRTSGGSLYFENINGPVKGKTSGGSIVLEGCKGFADVKTSGGSINIGHVEGEVSAHTSGGSISVDEIMGAIDASTSGGSISARISEQPKDDCRLTTSGGGVTVYLAKDINAFIDASTSSGRVKSDFDISSTKKKRSKSKLRGDIGEGGPELYLRTSGGNIRILEY